MRNIVLAILLVAVGSIQMLGDLLNMPQLKGLGLASHASPAPKVFTAHNGYETFSSRFFIGFENGDGEMEEVELDRERYQRLRGPYNRRNAYGAAFSYAPVLVANAATRPMFDSVSRFGLCAQTNILAELGIDRASVYRIRVEPRRPSAADTWQRAFDVQCEGMGS